MAGIVNAIAEIPQMQDGDTLNCVKGVISKVLDVKMDKAKPAKWKFQTLVIHDRNGHEAKVKIWDRETIGAEAIGKEIHLLSGRDDKNKQCGLYVKLDKHRGANANIINCSDKAELMIPGVMGSVNNQEPAQDAPPAQTQTQAPASTAPANTTAPAQTRQPAPANNGQMTAEQAILHAKKTAYKIANLWSIAFVAATQRRMEMAHQLGTDLLTEEQFQAMVSTICIQLEREGVHHVLPVKNIDIRPKEKTAAQ